MFETLIIPSNSDLNDAYEELTEAVALVRVTNELVEAVLPVGTASSYAVSYTHLTLPTT